MTKARVATSIEFGIMKALAILGEDDASEATGKSARLIRAWSDPDDDAHQAPIRQCAELDARCVLLGEPAPIGAAYQASIRRRVAELGGGPAVAPDSLMRRVAQIGAEFGDVARVASAAMEDGSVDLAERRRLAAELTELIDRATKTRDEIEPPYSEGGSFRVVIG